MINNQNIQKWVVIIKEEELPHFISELSDPKKLDLRLEDSLQLHSIHFYKNRKLTIFANRNSSATYLMFHSIQEKKLMVIKNYETSVK